MTRSAARRGAGGLFGILAATLCIGGAEAQVAPAPSAVQASPDLAPGFYRLPANTQVAVQLVDAVGTHETQSGATFAIKLAAPVIVDGQVVLRAGTPGVGRVVQSEPPGAGGKAAKLVLSAEFLSVPGGAVALKAMQLVAVGKDQSLTANVSSVGGLVFFPLGLVGFAVKGGDMEVPAGTAAVAKTIRSVDLPALAPASSQDYAAVRAMTPAPIPPGSFVLPDPPPGMGQVVFFRQHTALGTGQWFNVRDEADRALGKLDNGTFFVVPVAPGVRSFTAKTEPEFKDLLALKIDAGETYFVEAVLTKGVIIGVPDLTPSVRSQFDAAVSQMHAVAATDQATASR